MSHSGPRYGSPSRVPGWQVANAHEERTQILFRCLWAILFTGSFFVSGAWAGVHGVLLGSIGLLILFFPATASLPRCWWVLAAAFIIATTTSLLPADWFTVPEWRRHLESIGVRTGSQVAIQARQAAEMAGFFALMLLGGLWMAGNRPSSEQLRWCAMAFTVGVAVYAVISRISEPPPEKPGAIAHFGFFPNRNHTATYLAMGAVCGLGNLFQAQRDRHYFRMAAALLSTGICFWAIGGWSVSRSGILLSAAGALILLSILGTRYLGKNGIRAMALLGLAVIGGFLVADTTVKQRLAASVEKTGQVLGDNDRFTADPKASGDTVRDLDFRIPTAIDTLNLIRKNAWTGIGAGQYAYIFPQYRNMAAIANDSDSIHPESDWLWLAAETGIPATLALAALVVLALWKSIAGIRHGRDRSLRAGCLVAATLVPIHGLFDVPGHRITLAWSAAFLFSLSLHTRAPEVPSRPLWKWPSRLIAVCFVVAGIWLMRAQWWGGSQPAIITAQIAREQALALYQQDRKLQDIARAKGEIYQPEPGTDLLEQALDLLEPINRIAPLDRSILRLESALAIQFDDKYEFVRRNFAIERALDPLWVGAPLRQAEALMAVDPDSSVALFQEALHRADKIDRIKPGTIWSRTDTIKHIKSRTESHPDLRRRLDLP